MSDIEKDKRGKKGRRAGTVTEHRSRRVVIYQNANKPRVSDTAGAVPHFDDDDDDLTPAHARARAENENMMTADCGKTTTGNPVPQPGGRSVTDRVSPPRVTGQQSPSTGDHGFTDPMRPVGPRELAFRHPDLRQATTNPVPLLSMRTAADDFPRDLRGLSSGVPVALSRLDASTVSGLPGPSANPVSRPMDHQSRGSATPANGSHSLSDPQSHAVAMKASEAREILRRHMFPGSGGSR
jgi:hypothetical protein